MLATSGVTIIIQSLYYGICALLHIDKSSWWSSLIWGFIAGMVIISVLHYYSKPGRDEELLPHGKKPPVA
jgi:membrane protease YdiL (CAAX protease family)